MEPYFQTTPFTCAASSLLIILHHLNPEIELNRENEFDIWQKTTNLPTRGSSIYALANYAKKLGLNLQIIVEKKEYEFPDYRFYRYTKEDIEHAAFSSELHKKQAEENKIIIKEKKIVIEDIKKELMSNNILLLRINAKPIRNTKRNTSNYIVVHGYSESSFQIIDPALGALSISEEIMKESFESLETKKYRDHRMIVFKES
ncbi:MAG: peptidase C39 family protein [Nanoarchaeota archaeon]|nr:peptidase C39 family protein [Nanoarchaeota archaeon]MBU1632738.1 peptidase C39 family protein [Nanoarchaeota archaeon]MBU1876654.1 peptidase C39 family protein [Nanoarchaeota archaeon]